MNPSVRWLLFAALAVVALVLVGLSLAGDGSSGTTVTTAAAGTTTAGAAPTTTAVTTAANADVVDTTAAPDDDETTDESDGEPDDDVSTLWDPAEMFETPKQNKIRSREEVLKASLDNLIPLGSPLPIVSRSYAAVVADFNGDGLDDIQLSRHHDGRHAPLDVDGVWLADGSGGYALSHQLGYFDDRHACDVADVDGDGAIDLYCTLGASRGTRTAKANELWLNRGDGTFDNVSVEWGVDDPFGRGRDALFLDYDNDGDEDLYVLNAYGRTDELRSTNVLFENQGDRFVLADSAIQGEHGHKCPAVFDWNNDGWLDVMMCDGGRPVFFANEEGVFSDVTGDVLGEGKGWKHAVPADLDGDGDQDLAVIRNQSIEIWEWVEEESRFRLELEREFFHGRGEWIAVGDFYGDSSLDVYALVNRVDCPTSNVAVLNTHDVLLVGPDFEGYVRASHTLGCADRGYTVDGTKVLILNGQHRTRGPVEVADLRTSAVPLAPLPN